MGRAGWEGLLANSDAEPGRHKPHDERAVCDGAAVTHAWARTATRAMARVRLAGPLEDTDHDPPPFISPWGVTTGRGSPCRDCGVMRANVALARRLSRADTYVYALSALDVT